MCGQCFRAMNVRNPQYLGTAPMKQLTEGAGARRLRRSERLTAARAALEIGDTSEEAVNINETTTESVEETEHVEYAENI